MSLNLFWFLPTHGDGHYLGTEEGRGTSYVEIYKFSFLGETLSIIYQGDRGKIVDDCS